MSRMTPSILTRTLNVTLAAALGAAIVQSPLGCAGAHAEDEIPQTAPEGTPAPVAPEGLGTPQPAPQSITETEAPKAEAPKAEVEAAKTEAPPKIEEHSRTEDINPRNPRYQSVRPTWGVEMEGSLKALGDAPGIPNLGKSNIRGLLFQAEYQPAALQGIGVLGIGPTAAVYPVLPKTSLTTSILGFWSLGGQIRYQARFVREQLLVPVGGYAMEYFSYRLANGPAGGFVAKGPFFGAMLLLNWFDRKSAADFFVNYAVTRSYLVAEYRTVQGSDSQVTLTGGGIYLGIRVEF